ncbi:MAG TPA: TonB-dependent receptor [Gemmatimonadales bacterium]|nr:TonB-dependent receptor [Gemmatimonadales bacterium]
MILGRAAVLALALSGVAASGAAAQVDTTRRDTTAARDTTIGRDTTAARDTTTRDTIPALLPTFAPPIARGPLPRGARYTFTADSLLFSNVRTLSDLLGHIPGVYIARGGWYGQAELVLYGGRGPAALEVYWDGFPYLPLGRDSIYLDPARIPLAPLERVDVIVLPATLQVYLVTARPRSTAPGTQIGILTGDLSIADYRAGYSKRTRSGFGVSLLADWSSLDGSGGTGSTTTSFGTSDLWLKAEYVPPGGRLGASFQISSSGWHRNPAIDGRVDGWPQDRRDRLLRFFLAAREDGLGPRLTGTLATSAVSHDTLVGSRNASGASLELSQTWPRASVTALARFGAAGLPTQLEARAGWMPIVPLTLAASARHTHYAGGRTGERAYLTAGLALPLGFSARAEFAWQRDVQAPLVRSDPVQQATDVAGWVRFDHPRLLIEVGRGRRDPFVPLGFAAGIQPVRSLHPTPLTEFVAAHASIRPVPGLELSGWYFDAPVGGGDFEPPQHARISATFYSKFWRVFKSGIFALRAEVAVESWSRWGLGGITSTGAQLRMGGATFAETNVEMQLAGVTIFWIIRNVNAMRSSYVEGLGYPQSAQLYGARWFFTN